MNTKLKQIAKFISDVAPKCDGKHIQRLCELLDSGAMVFIEENTDAGDRKFSVSTTLAPGDWLWSFKKLDDALDWTRLWELKVVRVTYLPETSETPDTRSVAEKIEDGVYRDTEGDDLVSTQFIEDLIEEIAIPEARLIVETMVEEHATVHDVYANAISAMELTVKVLRMNGIKR